MFGCNRAAAFAQSACSGAWMLCTCGYGLRNRHHRKRRTVHRHFAFQRSPEARLVGIEMATAGPEEPRPDDPIEERDAIARIDLTVQLVLQPPGLDMLPLLGEEPRQIRLRRIAMKQVAERDTETRLARQIETADRLLVCRPDPASLGD